MNASTLRALLEDAFYQVLDNKLFRLLLTCVLLIVAFTFLVGYRESSVQILFGMFEVSYDQLLSFSGGRGAGLVDPQARAIQGFQHLLVESLSGNVGMVFSICATAFFMPKALEKGSADILFSKPVSRVTLLLSRYVAGLVFVGILAVTLVFGIYFGLLLVSGYNDPGFLWGALTLIYLFAILHAFSICMGVITRSTVAAILLSLLLFMGSGCIHQAWRIRDYLQEMNFAETLRAESSSSTGEEMSVPPALENAGKKKDAPKPSAFVEFMFNLLDGAHYALPKTSDADALTRKLRKAVARREMLLADDIGRFTASGNPEGFELSAPDPSQAQGGVVTPDMEVAPAVWVARSDGHDVGRIEISRRTRLQNRPGTDASGAKRPPRRLGTKEIADELLKEIKGAGASSSDSVTRKSMIDENYALITSWTEHQGSGEQSHELIVFSLGDWVFVLRASAEQSWISAHELQKRIDAFTGNMQLGRMRGNEQAATGSGGGGGGERFVEPTTWYEQRFGWTSELKYNAFFSLGSSLAFAIAMLLLAWFKLDRIDF